MASGGEMPVGADGAPAAKRVRVAEPAPEVNEAEAEPARELGPFESAANECVRFRLVRTPEDMRDAAPSPGFLPDFTHQIFGEDEIIYGYKELRVDIYFHCVTYHTLVEVKYAEKARGAGLLDRGAKEPDDILAKLRTAFPEGFTTSRDEFVANLPAYNAATAVPPSATVLAEGPGAGADTDPWKVLLLKLGPECPTEILQMHKRLEPLVLFTIDGANCIDADHDPKWDLILLVVVDAAGRPTVAGFCTLYRFYGYPDSQRFRISQVVVLPPYQQRRYGTRIIEAVYSLAQKERVLDVTVEDPTDVLRLMRDRVELQLCVKTPYLLDAVRHAVANVADTTTSKSTMDMPAELAARLRSDLKLSKAQIVRHWEVLLHMTLQRGEGVRPGSASVATAQLKKLIMRRLRIENKSSRPHVQKKDVMDTDSGFIMCTVRDAAPPEQGTDATATETQESGMGANPDMERAAATMMAATNVLERMATNVSGGKKDSEAGAPDGAEEDRPLTLEEQYEAVMQRLQQLTRLL